MGDRVEVILRRRRRNFSVEEKLRIVEETRAPGATVSAVAERYDVLPNVLYVWRRMAEGRPALPKKAPARRPAVADLIPVRIEPPPASRMEVPPGRIEIVLPGGTTVKVEGEVAPERLAAVLDTILQQPRRAR